MKTIVYYFYCTENFKKYVSRKFSKIFVVERNTSDFPNTINYAASSKFQEIQSVSVKRFVVVYKTKIFVSLNVRAIREYAIATVQIYTSRHEKQKRRRCTLLSFFLLESLPAPPVTHVNHRTVKKKKKTNEQAKVFASPPCAFSFVSPFVLRETAFKIINFSRESPLRLSRAR